VSVWKHDACVGSHIGAVTTASAIGISEENNSKIGKMAFKNFPTLKI
jgi:hypothetical protein